MALQTALNSVFLKMRVLILEETFISPANNARARAAHVTALGGMMGEIPSHFGPTLGKEGTENEGSAPRNCQLLAARLPPASGFPETPRGSLRAADARGGGVAVAPGHPRLEARAPEAAACTQRGCSPLLSRAHGPGAPRARGRN